MKTLRILGLIMIAGFLFSCEKDIEKDQVKQDVVFGIDQIDSFELKDGSNDITCLVDGEGNLIEPEWAEIVINGTTYEPKVFYLNSKLYTQAIKLTTKTDYEITKFVLKAMVDNTPTIVMATPEIDSDFEFYVDKPVAFTFDVPEFDKVEVEIEVLCFQPSNHEQFGFFWFNITEIVVREICFFGDVCIEEGEDYSNSGYADIFDLDDYPFDLPAIFMIEAYRNGDLYDSFSNVVYNEGTQKWEKAGDLMTVCARYSDYLNSIVNYEFVLKVMNANSEFVEVHEWNFTNKDPLVDIVDIDQQVVNFVVGDCTYGDFDDPDVQLEWPVTGPIVEEGHISGTIKKAEARWRNFRATPQGWKMGIGADIPSNFSNISFNYQEFWHVSPNYNEVTFTYDGSDEVTISSTFNDGIKSTSHNVGDIGVANLMQITIVCETESTTLHKIEFYDVALEIDGVIYPLGNFEAEHVGGTPRAWLDWSVTGIDLSNGFILTGKIKYEEEAIGEDHTRVNITIREIQ